jgi:GGDEF domain-containing protein
VDDETELPIPRISNAAGILLLAAAIPPLALALHALAGWAVALAACSVYALALGLTALAEHKQETLTRDPSTGLPDRQAAISRLEAIFSQRLAGGSQAAVFVISIDVAPGGEIAATDRHPVTVNATARLAQGLRRGDQIIRIGERSLAAILGPSRGLTAPAAENILDRIDRMFREPVRIGTRVLPVRVSLGACLQHDAPRADAVSWIEAAELAAELAAECSTPRLFPSGATKVDRSAWDDLDDTPTEGAADARWRAVAEGRVDDAEPRSHERRRESA